MSHVVPVLCLIAVVFYLNMKLGKEVQRIDKELQQLILEIKENKDNILKNKKSIENIKEHGECVLE